FELCQHAGQFSFLSLIISVVTLIRQAHAQANENIYDRILEAINKVNGRLDDVIKNISTNSVKIEQSLAAELLKLKNSTEIQHAQQAKSIEDQLKTQMTKVETQLAMFKNETASDFQKSSARHMQLEQTLNHIDEFVKDQSAFITYQ